MEEVDVEMEEVDCNDDESDMSMESVSSNPSAEQIYGNKRYHDDVEIHIHTKSKWRRLLCNSLVLEQT